MNDSNEPSNKIELRKLSERYTDRISFFGWCLSSLMKEKNHEYWVSALIAHFGVLTTLKIMRKAKFRGIFVGIPGRHHTDELDKFLSRSEKQILGNKTYANKKIDMSSYFKVIESDKSSTNRERISIADKVYSKLQKRVNEDQSAAPLIDSLKHDLVSGHDIDPYKYA